MPENILKLKKQAVAAGMPKADAMKADRKTLNAFLADDEKPSKPKKGVTKKKATKKGATTTTKKSTKKATKAERKATPTKPSTKKATRKPAKRSENTGDLGRVGIDKSRLDWSAESDEWNPKKGGPVEKLFKALKKSKGNIDKAYEIVKGDLYEFVGKTKRDGTKRTKDEAQAMLRYRLNRTLYEFAVRTGQHNGAASENRAAYGTGVYATTRKVKPARAKSSTKKSSGGKKSSSRKATPNPAKRGGKKRTASRK